MSKEIEQWRRTETKGKKKKRTRNKETKQWEGENISNGRKRKGT